jgi:SAM-dependent methyltransferase
MSDKQVDKALYDYLVAEYNHPVPVVWGDWSYLEGRRVELHTDQPWSYSDSVVEAMKPAQSVLDMRTGEGEKFAAFIRQQSHLMQLYATEGYAPSLAQARQRLAPLGVTVYEAHDERLPLADNQLDLVINRHGSYDPREVLRVLRTGHRFITQQVGDQTNLRLHELLRTPKELYFYPGVEPKQAWNLAYAVRELQEVGWQIMEQQEYTFPTRFYDVGAVVYYLKAVPWEVPDFSIERYFDRLVEIHHLIQREGYLDVPFHLFFLVAQKG